MVNVEVDQERGVVVLGRVFKTVVQLLKHNPALMKSVRILASEIQLSNGTIITAIHQSTKALPVAVIPS